MRIPIEASRQHRQRLRPAARPSTPRSCAIETDDGLVGWGEGKNAAGSAGTYAALVHLLNHEIGPRLIGRDPADIAAIWEQLYNGARAAARRGAPATPCPSSPGAA